MNTDSTIAAVRVVTDKYLDYFPGERKRLELLLDQLSRGEELNNRKNFRGHITGDGVVLSADHTKMLLIHHKFLDMWLQPGGHWDSDEEGPWSAAERETREETNVRIAHHLSIDANDPRIPFLIYTDRIPPNPAKKEAAHYHHGFYYCYDVIDGDITINPRETNEAVWSPINTNAYRYDHYDEVLGKLRSLKLI